MDDILTRHGFRVAVMKADAVDPKGREVWVADRVKKGLDVLICHPRLVQTGLDLIDFPTLVWFETDYSLYVSRQASRRSWRIGQTRPVKVVFMAYRNTLQADALKLVAKKLQSSLAVEGELPKDGLAAYGDDGDDMMMALARKLVLDHDRGIVSGEEDDAETIEKVYDQPKDTWIEIPVPQVIDDKTWERAQKLKKQRSTKARRNTKVLYLLQHLLKCGECGRNFHTRSSRTTTSVRNGKAYTYDLTAPRRYYMCNGMQGMRLGCREHPYIRAEQLEEPIWSEVKRVLQNPDLIVAGIATLDSQEDGGMEEEIAQAERDLRSIQMEEDRAIRLFVSGKITEAQLDLQRKFITERLESARAKLDDYRALEESGTEKRRLMEEVLAWARKVGQGLDELTPEERHDYLQMLVEQVIIDRDNNVDITLAIPIDDDSSDPDSPEPESPEPECVSIGSQEPSC